VQYDLVHQVHQVHARRAQYRATTPGVDAMKKAHEVSQATVNAICKAFDLSKEVHQAIGEAELVFSGDSGAHVLLPPSIHGMSDRARLAAVDALASLLDDLGAQLRQVNERQA
jgi:hypothetical protein